MISKKYRVLKNSGCQGPPFSSIDYNRVKTKLPFEGINFLERYFTGASK